jgi:hypothetical protein
MPMLWEPCPGNTNAILALIMVPFSKFDII